MLQNKQSPWRMGNWRQENPQSLVQGGFGLFFETDCQGQPVPPGPGRDLPHIALQQQRSKRRKEIFLGKTWKEKHLPYTLSVTVLWGRNLQSTLQSNRPVIPAAALNSPHPLSKTELHFSLFFSKVAKVLAGEKKSLLARERRSVLLK